MMLVLVIDLGIGSEIAEILQSITPRCIKSSRWWQRADRRLGEKPDGLIYNALKFR
jgi:hypothetical protein